jgi:hypothetical protein
MPEEQPLSGYEAVERELGSRFPWLPDDKLATVSTVYIERWDELGVDHYDTLTPELLSAAEAVGAELGEMIGPPPPVLPDHGSRIAELRARLAAGVHEVRDRIGAVVHFESR